MPLLNPKDGKKLRKTYKRTIIFLACIFVFALVECYLLQLAGISQIVNGIIIICTAAVLYLLFMLVCAKMDKRKEQSQKEQIDKDPFSKKKN